MVTDMKDYLWLIKTDKGDFFITVIGNYNLEEAARKLWLVFDGLKLSITAMIPRKLATGPEDALGTIYEQEEPKDLLGCNFLAGKKVWEACGREAEYQAGIVRLQAELKND